MMTGGRYPLSDDRQAGQQGRLVIGSECPHGQPDQLLIGQRVNASRRASLPQRLRGRQQPDNGDT